MTKPPRHPLARPSGVPPRAQPAAVPAKPVAKPPGSGSAKAAGAAKLPMTSRPDEKPHLTLAQLVKIRGHALTGGQAKHRVRDGGILVDGSEELRPGRKLFGGETVVIDGEAIRVELSDD